jgi:hypothetical protein
MASPTQDKPGSKATTPTNISNNVPGPNSNDDLVESHNQDSESSSPDGTETPSDDGEVDSPPLPEEDVPPLPEEEAPPLPDEAPPGEADEDDGWAPIWEETSQAFYFYNRLTGATQWDNPRVPASAAQPGAPGVAPATTSQLEPPPSRPAGGYDPAVHGDYDPDAWYAKIGEPEQDGGASQLGVVDPTAAYAATGAFNRFTGRWQAAELAPENHNDENKSKRQMNAFFDVDAAANSHDGRSLKAERSGKKLSKTELKQFKEKRKAKKEEKRRAWLRD